MFIINLLFLIKKKKKKYLYLHLISFLIKVKSEYIEVKIAIYQDKKQILQNEDCNLYNK